MKNKFRKYLFEIVVIFIGITISFLFEEWRNKRAERQKIKSQLTVLSNDLNRVKNWIEKIDSTYAETISYISDFRTSEGLGEEDFVELIWKISEDPIDFPLRELSPYLNQVSKSSELSSINESDKIITLIAYITNLTQEDYELSKAISDYTSNIIWSKLDQDDLLSKTIRDASDRWGTDTTLVWTDKRYSIKTFKNINADLYFIEFKINRILGVHWALKRQINRLKEELDKV